MNILSDKIQVYHADAHEDVPQDIAGNGWPATWCQISLIESDHYRHIGLKGITNALVFLLPGQLMQWRLSCMAYNGHHCLFKPDFIIRKRCNSLKSLPVFSAEKLPIFFLNDGEFKEVKRIILKMNNELNSCYLFKYDLVRNYLAELLHYGQKLQFSQTYSS